MIKNYQYSKLSVKFSHVCHKQTSNCGTLYFILNLNFVKLYNI